MRRRPLSPPPATNLVTIMPSATDAAHGRPPAAPPLCSLPHTGARGSLCAGRSDPVLLLLRLPSAPRPLGTQQRAFRNSVQTHTPHTGAVGCQTSLDTRQERFLAAPPSDPGVWASVLPQGLSSGGRGSREDLFWQVGPKGPPMPGGRRDLSKGGEESGLCAARGGLGLSAHSPLRPPGDGWRE